MEEDRLKYLLRRIAHHDDQEAFTIFFNHYHMRLMSLAMLFIPRYNDAEEVISEVFIKILKKKDDLPDIDNFEGYLFMMVKNHALNHLKKSKRDSRNVPVDDIEDYLSTDYNEPLEKLIKDDLRAAILQAIHSLPPKRQMVFKLLKDEGMSYKEVADLLEISERTVEVHLKLAIKDLREVLAKHYEDSISEASVSKLRKIL